ncbi:MAG: (4Fe-4S)-binding protein [Erysipelotrichales bacterium]
MDNKIIKYENEDIVVYWQPNICEHAALCVHGAPEVFEVGRSPWIKLDNGNSKHIINIIKQCPSRALTYKCK